MSLSYPAAPPQLTDRAANCQSALTWDVLLRRWDSTRRILRNDKSLWWWLICVLSWFLYQWLRKNTGAHFSIITYRNIFKVRDIWGTYWQTSNLALCGNNMFLVTHRLYMNYLITEIISVTGYFSLSSFLWEQSPPGSWEEKQKYKDCFWVVWHTNKGPCLFFLLLLLFLLLPRYLSGRKRSTSQSLCVSLIN